MARTCMRLTHLKKLPRRNSLSARQNWSDCPAGNLVAGRSACWPEEQYHAALGRTRHTACGTKRPAHKIRLDIRGDLPRPGWPRLSCRSAIPAGCKGTSRKYRHRSSPVHMLSLSLTRRAGTPPAHWISRTISPCCRHAARPRSKMSGNICDKTGCQTE